MQILFWVLVTLSIVSVLFAIALYSERASGDAGMAFIFFLPACATAIIVGGGAVLLRALRARALTDFDRRAGFVIGIFLLVGVFALGVVIALE